MRDYINMDCALFVNNNYCCNHHFVFKLCVEVTYRYNTFYIALFIYNIYIAVLYHMMFKMLGKGWIDKYIRIAKGKTDVVIK